MEWVRISKTIWTSESLGLHAKNEQTPRVTMLHLALHGIHTMNSTIVEAAPPDLPTQYQLVLSQSQWVVTLVAAFESPHRTAPLLPSNHLTADSHSHHAPTMPAHVQSKVPSQQICTLLQLCTQSSVNHLLSHHFANHHLRRTPYSTTPNARRLSGSQRLGYRMLHREFKSSVVQ